MDFIVNPMVEGNLSLGTKNCHVARFDGTRSELTGTILFNAGIQIGDVIQLTTSDFPGGLYKIGVGYVLIEYTTTASGGIPSSEKGAANGVATLDVNAKVPAVELNIATPAQIEAGTINTLVDSAKVSQDATLAASSKTLIPSEFAVKTYVDESVTGVLRFVGVWDASSNSFPTGSIERGDTYVVNVAGTLSGITFAVGDKLAALIDNPSSMVYAGNWIKFDNNDDVVSVFGRTGAVTATDGDYTAGNITNAPFGSITSDNLQAALNELETKKVAKSSYTGKGTILVGSASSVPETLPIGQNGSAIVYDSTTSTGVVALPLQPQNLVYSRTFNASVDVTFVDDPTGFGVRWNNTNNQFQYKTNVTMPFADTAICRTYNSTVTGSSGDTATSIGTWYYFTAAGLLDPAFAMANYGTMISAHVIRETLNSSVRSYFLQAGCGNNQTAWLNIYRIGF